MFVVFKQKTAYEMRISDWSPDVCSSDLVAGKARRIKILGTHYTLYRGADGHMRLVQDRCPHRGTSLAYGWVEGDSIRCRYHGWKFDGSGQGEDFPAETATYAANICLKTDRKSTRLNSSH